jgi:hypothetical protein
MDQCANCVAEACYEYVGIKYCNKDLPRFLRTKTGLSMAVRLLEPVEEPPVVTPPVSEEVFAALAAIAQAENSDSKPSSKKKATTKAD